LDTSVIIPVGNNSSLLSDVLLNLSKCKPGVLEVIVVDDGVSDGSLDFISKYDGNSLPVKVVRNDPTKKGPASGRNTGAGSAKGEVLLFIDSDVMLPSSFFARLEENFTGSGVVSETRELAENSIKASGGTSPTNEQWDEMLPSLSGVVGVQSAEMKHTNFASSYKNHWMRFTYLRLLGPVQLFYTSAAAILKSDFDRIEGFDENYRKPSVEDTAIGRELAKADITIYIDRKLEFEHRKANQTLGVLRTAFERAAELARLMLRMGNDQGGNKSSVPTGMIFSLPIAVLLPLWVAVFVLFPGYWQYFVG